ncbi:sigma-54 dependent transcriptional regulator [Sphingomonas sp. SUN039]|uniref:sigma-54-dependent transcriptional regulator n=1 Tax=Sphingomonas sp. SUN039 TaxID=2937787 RepID=UPI002164C1EE|nr:sigma-54 dependent transcriptional regulator [Sphingomonas sp. SUN039]UVO52756.1 sigma-54 dependent transcriptional regulator [Sphingomonas sp. SUN039]
MTGKGRILIIDDCAADAAEMVAALERARFDVHRTPSSAQAVALLDKGWDAILIALTTVGGDALSLLASVVQAGDQASVIAIDGKGAVENAVDAMRRGAHDFLVKPVTRDRLVEVCAHAVAEAVQRRNTRSGRRANDRKGFQGFIGSSIPMQSVYKVIDGIARSSATVFITGESGTGKEVAAEALHNASDRRARPFVAINCGAIPENLLESEIFGHAKGAFTGATENRIGAARMADGGTLFLDEICELDIKLQVKLLRFLQTGMIQRVGSSTAEKVDVRVVCATNRDPVVEILEGRFREDLFYRLAVMPLHLPPLRERGTDVLLIAEAFAERFAKEEQRARTGFSEAARTYLRQHDWPGNVRELQNAVRRAVILSSGSPIDAADLRPAFPRARPEGATLPAVVDDAPQTLDNIERLAIERAVARADGSLTIAARELGVSASTLYRKRERWQARAA